MYCKILLYDVLYDVLLDVQGSLFMHKLVNECPCLAVMAVAIMAAVPACSSCSWWSGLEMLCVFV